MSRFKPSVHRRVNQERSPLAPPRERMLADRTYRKLGRPPKLGEMPERRPPYLEAAVTALAFAFLIYLVLGGA